MGAPAPRQPLAEVLSEMSRALDSFRARLDQLGGLGARRWPASQTASEGLWGEGGHPLAAPEQDALGHFQEILSVPLTGLDPHEVFRAAIDRMLHVEDRAVLFLAESDQRRLQPRVVRGFRRDDLIDFSLLPGEGVVGRSFREGRPMTYATPVGEPSGDPFILRFPVRDAVALPIRAAGEVVGVLFAGHRGRPTPFTMEELQLLALIADRVGTTLEARRALEELKGAEEKLVKAEKARALEEMSGGIAHEFNNILAIILGKTQLILQRATDAQLREELGVVEEAAWRAAETVRRLQRFAATGTRGELSPLDLNSVIEEAAALTRPRWKDEAEARGIQVGVSLDLDERAPIVGNSRDLRELLVNLILNAVDAMAGGGRLTIRTSRHPDRVELTVTDTGVGMSEEIRRRIFEPFFTTRSPQRTGLGLSVVHGVVARHNASIQVESREGEGSCFRISFPPAPAPPAPASATPGLREPHRGDTRSAPASVLVIEDEDSIRRMLTHVLTAAGYTVEAAGDGLEGLARFEQGGFDVVVTDLSVPRCSGLEVSRQVKKVAPTTPVILITGWGELVDPARTKESGVDLTIAKPFRMDKVLHVLAEALELRRAPG
ncbi:MAG: ATP-binding protein [Candidatus Methylomirabilia bacterium]